MLKSSLGVRTTRCVAASMGVVGAIIALSFAGISPAAAQDYPSWSEVQQAKADEESKAAEIVEIEALLLGLQTTAGRLGDEAVGAAMEHDAALKALDGSKKRLDVLRAEQSDVQRRADELHRQIGAIAAQAYKTGSAGTSLLLMLDSDGVDGSANRLAVAYTLGGRLARLHAGSEAQAHAAEALKAQEEDVGEEFANQSRQAQEALTRAESSAAAADRAVADQQRRSATLLQQLASLKGTTELLETQRIRGLEAERAYATQQKLARAAAAAEAARLRDAGSSTASPPATRATAPVPQPSPEGNLPSTASTGPARPPSPARTSPSTQEPSSPVNPLPADPPGSPSTPAPVRAPGAVDDPAGAKAYASGRLSSFGWGADQFTCLVDLWNRESEWRTSATNPYSAAYGIPQSLPGSKMGSAGADWRTNYRTQIEWGLGYISDRYGTPCSAWAHSEGNGWY